MSVKPRLVWSREYWDCGEVFSLCLLSQDWFDHVNTGTAVRYSHCVCQAKTGLVT